MVPRIDVIALEINTPLPEAVDTLLQSGYSRLPVYNETIDNLRGLLYAKDLLRIWQEEKQLNSIEEILRPAYYVPETKKVDELLEEMQAHRIHMGIVVDEYGGVAGIVTLEDIVEEIVGEIQDEYDEAEEMPFAVINDSEYIFQGRVDLDDFNDIMASELPKDEADTLGGYIYSRIGRVPTGGEMVKYHDLQLTVEQVTGRRIRKVRVNKISPKTQNAGAENYVE
jgi:CBS domain containing-hemolysin-like protein